MHSYTRDTYMFNGTNSSMLNIVVGGAGNDEMAQAPASADRGEGSAAFATGRYATGLLTANRTHLVWELIDSVAWSTKNGTDTVLDRVVLSPKSELSLTSPLKLSL